MDSFNPSTLVASSALPLESSTDVKLTEKLVELHENEDYVGVLDEFSLLKTQCNEIPPKAIELKALAHFQLDQYVDALACWNQIPELVNDPKTTLIWECRRTGSPGTAPERRQWRTASDLQGDTMVPHAVRSGIHGALDSVRRHSAGEDRGARRASAGRSRGASASDEVESGFFQGGVHRSAQHEEDREERAVGTVRDRRAPGSARSTAVRPGHRLLA